MGERAGFAAQRAKVTYKRVAAGSNAFSVKNLPHSAECQEYNLERAAFWYSFDL
jgi:hypothetical protein